MTGRGRHLGMVRGGRSRKHCSRCCNRATVELVWRARLEEHLGQYQVELLNARAGRLMESAIGVHGVQAMAALLRLLPERDSHPRLHDAFAIILDSLDAPQEAGALYVRFELAVLEDLGFGLDLSTCAATGAHTDLIYVSPKSGRAVCAEAGAPWADRMLALPAFLPDRTQACTSASMLDQGSGSPAIFSAGTCSSRAVSSRRSAARVFARPPCGQCRKRHPFPLHFRNRFHDG
jgi:DNA repair protein RecO (recombination protein O)